MRHSVGDAIAAVLLTADPRAKAMAARRVARDWRQGRLDAACTAALPDYPARPATPELLAPKGMPRRKGGSASARIAMLHALAHIEFVAIDLALDMAARFGAEMGAAFIGDFLGIAADEAMHFALLERRLQTLGSYYGALPAHDGLWEAARGTAHDVAARLAVVPMVLEARGLDVTPAMIARASASGDSSTARLLKRILDDETRHVAIGAKHFVAVCQARRTAPRETWKSLVSRHFSGELKAPFNDSARQAAGLPRDWYGGIALVTISDLPPMHEMAGGSEISEN